MDGNGLNNHFLGKDLAFYDPDWYPIGPIM